jgi:hypothetical protein
MGARVLLWLVVLVLLFFLFLARRGLLGFLVLWFAKLALLLRRAAAFLFSRSRDLRCSSDEPLSELAPYADSVYSESVSLFSIIELRNDTKLATECAVPAFGAGASRRVLPRRLPRAPIR